MPRVPSAEDVHVRPPCNWGALLGCAVERLFCGICCFTCSVCNVESQTNSKTGFFTFVVETSHAFEYHWFLGSKVLRECLGHILCFIVLIVRDCGLWFRKVCLHGGQTAGVFLTGSYLIYVLCHLHVELLLDFKWFLYCNFGLKSLTVLPKGFCMFWMQCLIQTDGAVICAAVFFIIWQAWNCFAYIFWRCIPSESERRCLTDGFAKSERPIHWPLWKLSVYVLDRSVVVAVVAVAQLVLAQ